MPAGGSSAQVNWNDIPDETPTNKNTSAIDTPKLSQEIADIESAGGNYKATNPSSSATGKYQFLWNSFGDDIRRVTGVKTKHEFLNNPDAQEKFFQYHVENNLKPSIENLREFNRKGYSDSQLAKLVHFKGEGGAKDFLISGADETKAHNVSIPSYIGDPEGASKSEDDVDWNSIPDESTTDPQKKSPDESATGLANSSQSGQTGASPNSDLFNTNKPAFADSVLQANKDKDWVKRLYDPSAPDIQVPGEPYKSTHLMSDDGNGYIFPSIVRGKDGKLVNLGDKAEDYARETKTGIQLPKDQGTWFAANGYKTAPGVMNDMASDGTHVNNPNFKIDGTNEPVLSKQALTDKIFGQDLSGHPLVSATPLQETNPTAVAEPADVKKETGNSSDYLMKDIADNLHNLPSSYADNLHNTPFTQPGNIIHDITDPHGNPTTTGGYTQTRLAQLESEKQRSIHNFGTAMDEPGADTAPRDAVVARYNDQIHKLKDASSNVIDLQLAYKAQQDKNFDPIKIGIEKQKALGDKQAEKDEIDLNNGKSINPEAKVHYQSIGLASLQKGKENANANDQHAVAEQIGEHSDNPEERLEKDNPEYFKNQRIQQIANQLYKTENAVHGSLISRESVSQEELEKSAKELGYTKKQIKDIKPEEIPRSAGFLNQAVQGFNNTMGAPLYEGGMRALATLGIANKEEVNKRFTPGWAQESGAGSFFTGKMPEEQSEIALHNPRGVLGAMAKGIGDLGGFLAGGEATGALLKGTGLVADATKANTIANFATAALPSYNSAYENSVKLIGDAPEDEWKRQLYSTYNGILGGAVMLIDPKANIGRDIIGETKAGKSFVNSLKNDGVAGLTHPELTKKASQIAQETFKHVGLQVGMAEANTIGENLSKMVLDPNGGHDLTDNVSQSAISAGVGMFLPSLIAGAHYPSNQSSLNKSIAWEVGKNPKAYQDEVRQQYKDGKLTKDEAVTSISAINTMSHVINNEVPYQSDANGKELTPSQQQDYAWNTLVEHQIDNKLAGLPENEKTQRGILEKRKKEFEAKKIEIINKAGEAPGYKKPTLPPQEIEEPQPNGANANQAESTENTPPTKKANENQKKYEERLAEFNKNNIPLSPQEDQTTKTNENERKRTNEVRSNNEEQSSTKESKSEDNRPNTEVRSDANEGLQEGSNSGNKEVVKPTEEKDNEKVAPKEQPLSVSGRKRRKLILDDEPADIPAPKQKEEFAAWDRGTEEGKDADQVNKLVAEASPDTKIGGGESFNEFKDRIKEAWAGTAKSAKDQTLLVAHSGVMRILQAAEKVGWDNSEKLKEAFLKEPEPGVKDIHTYKGENGEIHLQRHGESQDGANGLDRTKDTPLSEKGQQEAETTIPENLKKEGIVPSEIITDKIPRTVETAKAVHETMSGQDYLLPPQPDKPLHEMTGDELEGYHKKLKDYNKNIDKTVLGDRYKEYNDAQRVSNSSFASDEARKKADKTIDEIEESLSDKQKDALWGMNLPEGIIANDEDVRDFRDKVQAIESSQSESELAKDISQSLIDLNNAPDDINKMSIKQKHAVAAMITAKRLVGERGYDGKKVTEQALKFAAGKFADKNDAEFMLSKYIDYANKQSPSEPKQERSVATKSIGASKPVTKKLFPETQEKINKGIGEETPADASGRQGEDATPRSDNDKAGGNGKEKGAGQKTVKSFETSQGSKYEANEDGKFTRTKTKTGEVGEPQDHTVFIKFKDDEQKQRFLDAQDREGAGTKVSLIGKGDEMKVVLAKTGKVIEEVETTTTPTEGYNTYDQRRFTENGKEMRESHIGNEVTKINYAEPEAPKENILTKAIREIKDRIRNTTLRERSESEDIDSEDYKNRKSQMVLSARKNGLDVGGDKYAGTFSIWEKNDKRDDYLVKDVDLQDAEKLVKAYVESNQGENQERIVAPEAKSLPEPPKQKPLSPEEKIKAERVVHQKLIDQGKEAEKERQAAIKSKDPDAIQKATDKVNGLKDKALAKEAKIDRLIEAQENESIFHKVADYVESTYARNKKSHEGESYATILGISPKIADHVSDYLVARVVEALHGIGNVEIAIRRGLRLTKEKYGDEAKELSEKDIDALKESGLFKAAHLKNEPVLPIDHEEYAKDILADILDGKITHEEARQEILNEVIENRQGNPVSDIVAENAKAKILNYIDWHVENDVTSIRNATTRLRRQQFGLDEEVPAIHKSEEETMAEAKKEIEDGRSPQNLVDDLVKKPRPLTDVENGILLHYQNTKELKLQELNNKINKAAEEGNQILVDENKLSKARILDELQQIYDVNKAAGTENARGLASRRMMMNRKYSLVNMIAEKRATANDGKPLSENQQAEIEKLHQKVTETQKAFDDYVNQSESKIIDLQRKALSGTLKDKGAKVANRLRAVADKIEKSNKNQIYSSPIPITPKMVAEAIRLVADGIEKGGQLLDHVQAVVNKMAKDNPGIDKRHLEKEINKSLIDSEILEPSPVRKEAKDMSGLFANGKYDRQAEKLKIAADRAKDQVDINLKIDQKKQLTGWAKGHNGFIKWQRFNKLSGILTLGKLTSAAVNRLGTDAAEDVVGGAWSFVFPKLAKGAIGEGGGLNVNDMAAAYTGMWMRGFKDAADIMRKSTQGKSDLEILMGKGGELPPEALDVLGRVHSMIKAPVKRYAFEKSIEKRLRRNLAAGIDVSDPMVQTTIIVGALKDANRAIFMQDNAAADWFQRQIRSAEKIDPKTGKSPDKWKATLAQWMVPFVKVPTNIVAETARGAYGLPVGVAQALHATFIKGVESLSEDQKDIIFRNLKKGTIGAAALTLGYMLPQNFGGYYQQGQKRKEDEANVLGAKIGDMKIPGWLIESPIYQLMQLGATIRRVKDKKVHGEENGIGEGVWAGLLGLTENIPMVNQPMRILKALGSPGERNYFVDELAKTTLIPSAVDYVAKVSDPADERPVGQKIFEPENHRKSPKTLGQHIESAVPGLRENLPAKGSNGHPLVDPNR